MPALVTKTLRDMEYMEVLLFFAAMAVTIMFGLTFACVLTLIVVPVLYAMFYRIGKTS